MQGRRVTPRWSDSTKRVSGIPGAVQIDADENLLRVTKDGAQKPIFITTPDAMKVGAILATLTEL